MAVYFFDSSALAKCYVAEKGTLWVRGLTDAAAANETYLLRLTEVEITSALARRRKSGALSRGDTATALTKFRHDLANEYQLTEITPLLLASAVALVETHSLRANDGLQLAGALMLNTQRAAMALNAAAAVEGIPVQDPNDFP